MTTDYAALALGADRMVLYSGFVLLCGVFGFWVLVWPDGPRDQRLRTLAALGAGLVALNLATQPLLQTLLAGRTWASTWSPVAVLALSCRLLGVVGAVATLHGTGDQPVRGRRKALAVGVIVIIAASMVLQSNAVEGPWAGLKVAATAAHVLATSAWLGGLVALAAVLIPREFLSELDALIPRFSVVATTSIVVLAVTGVAHALAETGGLTPLLHSRYGLVLIIKTMVFAAMLVLGNHGRRYAARVAFRAAHRHDHSLRSSTGVHLLAVVMGAELTVAFVVLGVTSLLVALAPHP